MSLQPGPQDPNDESALTPAVPPENAWEAPPPGAAQGASGQDRPTEQVGSPPAAQAPDAGWPTAPPTSAAGPPEGVQPAGGAPGYAPPPPVDGWAAPPPPTPGYPYAPPPVGSYAGPPPNYPPAGYPPQGYQAVGYPAPRQNDSKAVIGLVLAITSWLVCPLITAIAALVLAGQSNRAIEASGGRLEGRSMNSATKVIAWINIVVSILALMVLVVGLMVLVASDSSVITDQSTQF